MADFTHSKEDLKKIVSACQERSYAEEVDLLMEKGDSIDWLVKDLQSDPKLGISNDVKSIEDRLKKYGTNARKEKEPPGLLELFCIALQDFTLRILIVAALISMALELGTAHDDERSTAWIEGFAILVAVMICASVCAINDYQKQRQFRKLNQVADQRKKMTIWRNGQQMQKLEHQILVGDIVNVVEGMEVPADGILIESSEVETDESAMTGQIDHIHKNILKNCIQKKEEIEGHGEKNLADRHEVPSPIIMSGTKIVAGSGKMIVLVVGDLSCIGVIKSKLQKESEPTPLQQKLETVAEDIGRLGLYAAIFIVVVLFIRFGITKGIEKTWDTGKDLPEMLNFLILGISVVVVAIPEGLPLSVTLSLAFSVRKMLEDQNLVRKMQACETMGGANNICSDKTGTLTTNVMTLTQIWNGNTKMVQTAKDSFSPSDLSNSKQYFDLFKVATCVNSSAFLLPEEKGSSTEISILKYMKKMGVNYQDVRVQYEKEKITMPFSSSRKRMSVIVRYNGEAYLFVKGASEIIIKSSTNWWNTQTNEVEIISENIRNEMNSTINTMAEDSLRTLGIAYKKLAAHDDLESKDKRGIYEVEKDKLTVLGILGVMDLERPEVPGAIAKCHKAGITVRMVTGDNIVTAKAIARKVGILKEGVDSLVMEGPDFHKLVGGTVCKKCRTEICDCAKTKNEAEAKDIDIREDTIGNAEEFDKIKDTLLVLARSRPEDKYTLVVGLKERGNVVAVTGDGTNDAPALSKADVGFAMGIAGTEVARQAAAIILLDDNFNSIVKAVEWGRNIYDSIRKFIQFQLTVNVVAVGITLISAALLKQEVLKPIQMLWVNLIMDTLGSLALATEAPNPSLLERAPHSRDEYIVSKTMIKHIAGQSAFQLVVLCVLVFAGEFFIPEYIDSYDTGVFKNNPEYKWHDGVIGGTVRHGRYYTIAGAQDYQTIFEDTKVYSRHMTFVFTTFVMMQIFNFVNCRKLHDEINVFSGISKNPMFYIIVIAIFFLQIIIVTFTGSAFGVYSNYGLTVQQWGIAIAIGSVSLIISILLKLCKISTHGQAEQVEGGIGRKPTDVRRKSILSIKRIEERVERDLAKNHPFD